MSAMSRDKTERQFSVSSVAIIMDGNGRWAESRLLPRSAGHAQGVKNIERVLGILRDLGVRYVTLYAFSTENWKRPKNEVDSIMKLLSDYIDDAVASVDENNIQLLLIFILDIGLALDAIFLYFYLDIQQKKLVHLQNRNLIF